MPLMLAPLMPDPRWVICGTSASGLPAAGGLPASRADHTVVRAPENEREVTPFIFHPSVLFLLFGLSELPVLNVHGLRT